MTTTTNQDQNQLQRCTKRRRATASSSSPMHCKTSLAVSLVLCLLSSGNTHAFVIPRTRINHQRHLCPHRKPYQSPPSQSVSLQMSLLPLPVAQLNRLIATRVPTAQQYASYWGRSGRERYNRLLESAIVSFVGVTFSYFMSFVLGSLVATIFGTLFLFWGILSPELKAYQRNWEFVGGRTLLDPTSYSNNKSNTKKQGLYGALFIGRIQHICVVEDDQSLDEYDLMDFEDYNMETDELEKLTGNPYLLRVTCCDSTGRSLQVHARMTPDYLNVQVNLPVLAVLLSKSSKFSTLAALTDVYVPDENVWIGDYPYLDRVESQVLVEEDERVMAAMEQEEEDADAANANVVWDDESTNTISARVMDTRDDDYWNADEDEVENENDEDFVLARRKRRRRSN